MDAPVLAALLTAIAGFSGALLGVFLQLQLFRRKRQDELESLYRSEQIKVRDIVRLYADPLLASSKSLNYRLKEILEHRGRATFLLPETPQSEFVLYKRISTMYRLAALLGWIRAYRRERSYVDPGDTTDSNEIERAVERVEAALADGPHVEDQRLNELLRVWVPSCPDINDSTKRELAVCLDNLLHAALTKEAKTNALQVPDLAKKELCDLAAESIASRISVNIPSELIAGEINRAIVFFSIKEAYVYRDWQQAIGELVLVQVSGGTRRFDVMGYGDFEQLVLTTDESQEKRWINRLNDLFEGIEPNKEDVFDARREQLRAVHCASHELQVILEKRINQYSKFTSRRYGSIRRKSLT